MSPDVGSPGNGRWLRMFLHGMTFFKSYFKIKAKYNHIISLVIQLPKFDICLKRGYDDDVDDDGDDDDDDDDVKRQKCNRSFSIAGQRRKFWMLKTSAWKAG